MSRILVIDDEIATCSLVGRILRHFGYKTKFTDDAESAVRIMDAFVPHLIITDLKMPRMDGIALLKMSKDHFPFTPVLAMADGSVTRDEVEQLGFDGYILKPPVISELLEEAKTALEEKVKSILVVDDVDDVREVIKEVLDNFAFDVIDVETADEAVGVLGTRKVDLVISDCSMPGMRGTEFLGLVKKRYPGLPFIVASATFPREEVKQLKPHGVLRKPFDFEDLKGLIHTALVKQ